MNRELAGYDDAIKLGYSLHSSSVNGLIASYVDERGIVLTVSSSEYDGTCRGELSYVHGLVVISVPSFSFPGKNFKIFEDSINKVLDAII